jgi:hypothetical protein
LLKTKHLLPPLLALAIAGTWLGSQRQRISSLEERSRVLQQAMVTRQTEGLTGDSSVAASKLVKGKEPLDWKKIAASLAEMQRGGGMSDMRSQIKLQQRLQAMSQEELISALDEIATLDLPKESRKALEQTLMSSLAQKDPEYALTRFNDRLHNDQDSMSWLLANAMSEWIKKDPARANMWFDEQITAGKFDSKSLDGKSRVRLTFEACMIDNLLGSDPDSAGRRLASLPEDQRKETLQRFNLRHKEEDQAAFAKLVRAHLPKDDQASALANKASALADDKGYVKVTEFLGRVNATPAERQTCVERTATSRIESISFQKKVTRSDLDTMREWVNAQAPEVTGSVTGKALAEATRSNRGLAFSEAAEFAVEYNTAAGNDEVLKSFLDGYPARQNKDQALLLAQKITDESVRAEILKKLE